MSLRICEIDFTFIAYFSIYGSTRSIRLNELLSRDIQKEATLFLGGFAKHIA